MEIDLEIVVYLGVVLGVLAAFILPWLKKNADIVAAGGEPLKFNMKYIYAFLIEVFIVAFTIGTLLEIVPIPDDGTGMFTAFWGAFVYGIISAYAVKMPFDWLVSNQAAKLALAAKK